MIALAFSSGSWDHLTPTCRSNLISVFLANFGQESPSPVTSHLASSQPFCLTGSDIHCALFSGVKSFNVYWLESLCCPQCGLDRCYIPLLTCWGYNSLNKGAPPSLSWTSAHSVMPNTFLFSSCFLLHNSLNCVFMQSPFYLLGLTFLNDSHPSTGSTFLTSMVF